MTFTDEDLKRLKWSIENHAPNWADKDNLAALLARLEAAEKAYLLYRNDPDVRHTPEQVEAGLAWRKAAGK